MPISEQQLAPVKSIGDAKINAVAGSGKTTTLVYYAQERANNKLLYLAFNKSVRAEAKRKFVALPKVTVETAHSLAFRSIVLPRKYTATNFNPTLSKMVKHFGITPYRDDALNQALAHHALKYAAIYCNSVCRRINEMDYLDYVKDQDGKDLIHGNYEYLQKIVRDYLGEMYKGNLDATHDFYLKEYQLTNPKLSSFDNILFDEGQDASAVMLDIFLKQNATKVIVGDTHQQIYGWRNAVNSLEQVDFPTYQLNQSWRFDKRIAAVANEILSWKTYLDLPEPVPVIGRGTSRDRKIKATIGRKNISLLASAIKQVLKDKTAETVYFEGRFDSYTFSDSGSSLYDIVNLYLEKNNLIRDPLIAGMKNLKALEEHAKMMDDKNMSLLIQLVEEHGERLPFYINEIKSRNVPDEEREKADMIFSTVHKCKGMEYDEVTLLKDFITRKEIERMVERQLTSDKAIDIASVNEEINLLYVAVTRAKYWLNLPGELNELWNVAKHMPDSRYQPIY